MAPRMRRRITSARRQEIEKEQEAMAKSIVRPFDVVSGLPVSYVKPPYGHYEDVLKNPLTVKDSGVLYRSLMKSRNNYINGGPMFSLFWVKSASRRFVSDSKSGKNEVLDRAPVLGTEVNARDVMVKLSDARMTIGPHNFEIRMFIAKDHRSEKKKTEEEAADIKKEPTEGTTTAEETNASSGTKDGGQPKENGASEAPTSTPEKAITPAAAEPKAHSKENGSAKLPEPSVNTEKQQPAKLQNSTPTPKPAPGAKPTTSTATTNSSQQYKPQIPASKATPGTTSTPGKPLLGKPAPPPLTASSKAAKTDKSDPSSMQSPQNVLMISNLNAIARIDPSLNLLMKIVAAGNASPNQIMTFQGYIARAREMGPPPHPWLLPDTRIDPHQPLRIRKVLKEVRKPLKTQKIPKDQKLTAFQEKYISNATLLFEFVENPNVRYMLPKNAICEVLPSKMSGDDRDILVSFLWIHNQNELDKYERDFEEFEEGIKERERQKKEQEEKDRLEKERLEEEQLEQERLEKERLEREENGTIEETTEETAPTEEQTDDSIATRAKKRPPPPKKKKPNKPQKKLIRPIEPDLRFTSVSFTIHDIPAKFVPIITNSVNHEDKVREYMKNIIEKGTRTSSFYLWYQVDGKVDEALAESIRVELNQEEKKINGVQHNSALAAAKRRKFM